MAHFCFIVLSAAALLGGCSHASLHPSYAQMNAEVFSAQASLRSGRDAAHLWGDEAKRVISTYYSSMGDSPSDGAAGGGSAPSVTRPPIGGAADAARSGGGAASGFSFQR